MLDSLKSQLRRYFVNLSVKRLARKKRNDSISLRNCWQNVDSCVVCLSGELRDLRSIEVVFEKLRKRFPESKITTVTPPEYQGSPSENSGIVIQLKTDEFHYSIFPSRKLKEKLQKLKADVAIDLSLDYDAMSAFVCMQSGARLRIGFVNAGSDVFNYQISPLKKPVSGTSYQVMADYIG